MVIVLVIIIILIVFIFFNSSVLFVSRKVSSTASLFKSKFNHKTRISLFESVLQSSLLFSFLLFLRWDPRQVSPSTEP